MIKKLTFVLGRMYFTSTDALQNMFVYQPTFSTIKYRDTNTEYVIGWKSKGVYVTDPVPIKSNFLPHIKYFKHGIGIQFNHTPLVAVLLVP